MRHQSPRDVLTTAKRAVESAMALLPVENADGWPSSPKLCPACGTRGRCVDARESGGSCGGYRRRYNCGACGARWSSREVVVVLNQGGRGQRRYGKNGSAA